MKKILAFALVLFLFVSLVACKDNNTGNMELSRKVQSLKHPKFFCWGCDF